MLFLCWQIIRISTKHEEKITHLSIQSIKNRKFKIHENKKIKDYKQSSTGPNRLFMCETLPHWPTLLSPDCVFEDETIAADVLIKTVSFLWKKKKNHTTAFTDCCMCPLRDVHRQTRTHVHTRTHRERQRGYWCEWLSRGQGRDWGINWGSLFHTGESIKCHVTAMPWGVTGKQYPKCAERKAAENKKEREIKAQWRGGGGALCCLPSPNQQPSTPPKPPSISASLAIDRPRCHSGPHSEGTLGSQGYHGSPLSFYCPAVLH